MVGGYGGRNAGSLGNRRESANSGYDTGRTEVNVMLGNASSSVDDMIGMHLVDCDQCRKASTGKPLGIGQKSGHCETYWQMQLERAKYEGYVNNVVAYTEYGDEAPKGKGLE